MQPTPPYASVASDVQPARPVPLDRMKPARGPEGFAAVPSAKTAAR